MKKFKFRWKNFRCFEDTGEIIIKPLTIFIGPNNCGKTSLLLPFLLMMQSLKSLDVETPLKITGDYVTFGDYRHFAYNQKSSNNVEFHLSLIDDKKSTKKKSTDKPKDVIIIFKKGTIKSRVLLDEFTIKDKDSNILLRIKSEGSKYKLTEYKYMNELNVETKDFIDKSRPNNFIFLPEQIMTLFLTFSKHLEKTSKIKVDTLFKQILKYSSLLDISSDIQNFIERIDFVGPIRAFPNRIYYLSGDKPRDVGPTGEYTPEILYHLKGTLLGKQIDNKLFEDFGIKYQIDKIGRRIPWAFTLSIKDIDGNLYVDFADVGFGYSQLLPLIVQGLYTQKDEMFIAEQPEIHLNPKIQSKLGDFFVHLATEGEKYVMVETHSEHILLRIRRLIAEGKIESSDVALYFVWREKGKSFVQDMNISDNGHIDDSLWPMGFFDDTITESLKLSSAQQEWYEKNMKEKI